MKFQGSVIRDQGVTFGMIIVKPHVLESQSHINEMLQLGNRAFGFMPIILMSQNSRGVPTYYGRKDIVQFLSKISVSRIPWKEYTLS